MRGGGVAPLAISLVLRCLLLFSSKRLLFGPTIKKTLDVSCPYFRATCPAFELERFNAHLKLHSRGNWLIYKPGGVITPKYFCRIFGPMMASRWRAKCAPTVGFVIMSAGWSPVAHHTISSFSFSTASLVAYHSRPKCFDLWW